MNWMEGFNKVINYVEEHLEEEIDNKEIAEMLSNSPYHFQRLFMMVTGVPFAEYVRSRRLAKAAVELQTTEHKIIDVALKYGYSSPGAFDRAFKIMHGITPTEAKKVGGIIKAYPPLSFSLTVKGATTMDYHIEKKEAFRVVGLKIPTTTAQGQNHKEIATVWGELMASGRHNDIMELMNQEPYGLLGLSDYDPELSTGAFDYYIACSSDVEVPEGMAELAVPTATWAIFSCESVQALPQLQQQMIMDWLPTSGYEFCSAPDIEYYNADGTVEAWLPVVKAKS